MRTHTLVGALFLLTVSLITPMHAQDAAGTAKAAQAETAAPAPAQTVLDAAYKKAKSQHKNVLVIFHASWCGWCKRLEAVMDRPEFAKPFAANYVVVHLDVMENGPKKSLENAGGVDLMKTLGGEKSGLPFYAFLDAKGKKLADSNVMPGNQNIGYPGAPEEIAAFGTLLQQTAPKWKADDRQKLIDYLKENAPPSTGH